MARAARIFAPIDVNYFDDDRVLEAGDAWQLHIAAILACKKVLSDGRITRRQLARIAPESVGDIGATIATLIRVGLFDDLGDSVEVRSWSDWNDSAADVEAMATNGKKGNHLRWHVRRNKFDKDCAFCIDRGESGGDIGGESGGESQSRDRSDVDQRRADKSKPSFHVSNSDASSESGAAADASSGGRSGFGTVGANAQVVYDKMRAAQFVDELEPVSDHCVHAR